MFPFETPPQVVPQKEQETTDSWLFTQAFDGRSSFAAIMADSQKFQNKGSEPPTQSIDKFGAISHMDLPRGFVADKNGGGNIGAMDERIYRDSTDHTSFITVSRLHAPLVMPEAQEKLKTLLSGSPGTLTDAQRAEASAVLAKFGDNQYKPGNSAAGYGSAWTAPNYFVRSMEIREVDGKKILAVDGAYTPPPWTPKDGLDKASTRFSAAFMLDKDNAVQTVYLEAKPQDFKRHESSFLYSLKKAKLSG